MFKLLILFIFSCGCTVSVGFLKKKTESGAERASKGACSALVSCFHDAPVRGNFTQLWGGFLLADTALGLLVGGFREDGITLAPQVLEL